MSEVKSVNGQGVELAYDLPDVLSVDQLAAFLRLSRSMTYQLVNNSASGLRVWRFGRVIRVYRHDLLYWIQNGDTQSMGSAEGKRQTKSATRQRARARGPQ